MSSKVRLTGPTSYCFRPISVGRETLPSVRPDFFDQTGEYNDGCNLPAGSIRPMPPVGERVSQPAACQ